MKNCNCTCCGSIMKRGKTEWHFRCSECGYESGELVESINSPESHAGINETEREIGLESLRMDNFKSIVDRLTGYSGGRKLLDVGCAHGWFLELAVAHFDVTGIEPDVNVAKRAIDRNLPVRTGFFPDMLDKNEKFDIITFNDVIEHIPDVKRVMSDCRNHLNSGGLLSINIPVSDGVIYRISKIFLFFGIKSFFNRMWQVGFPSPHLHYFNSKNFTSLAESYGFRLCEKNDLKSISLKGLNQRIKYSDDFGFLRRLVIVVLFHVLFPVLNLFNGDVCLLIYRVEKE